KGHKVVTGGRPGFGGPSQTNVGKVMAAANLGVNNSFVAGLNLVPLTLPQSVTDIDTTLSESWDANAMYALRLNPTEAAFVNSGSMSIQTDGDLQVQLVSLTSSE